jgi:RNA polymerase sigma factor (sigma-70 family)
MREDPIRDPRSLIRTVAWKMNLVLPAHIELSDVVQEGWFGYRYAENTYRPGKASFRTWAIYQIRMAIKEFLRRSDSSRVFYSLEDIHTYQMEAQEDYSDLRYAVMQLPDRERYIVIHRYWRDQTFAEIANGLGVTYKNAYGIHARAINRLQGMIGEGVN